MSYTSGMETSGAGTGAEGTNGNLMRLRVGMEEDKRG
jgi:hypothetical protein